MFEFSGVFEKITDDFEPGAPPVYEGHFLGSKCLFQCFATGFMSEDDRLTDRDGSTLTVLQDPINREAEFREDCQAFVQNAGHEELHVDLTEVQLLSSSNIGAIVYIKQMATKRGKKVDFSVSSPVRGIIRIYNLQDYLGVAGDGKPSKETRFIPGSDPDQMDENGG